MTPDITKKVKLEPLLGSYKPVGTRTAQTSSGKRASQKSLREPLPVKTVNLGPKINEKSSIEYLRNTHGLVMAPEYLVLEKKRAEIRHNTTTKTGFNRDEEPAKLPHLTIREKRMSNQQQARGRLKDDPKIKSSEVTRKPIKYRSPPACAQVKTVDKIAVMHERSVKHSAAAIRRRENLDKIRRKHSVQTLTRIARSEERIHDGEISDILDQVRHQLRETEQRERDEHTKRHKTILTSMKKAIDIPSTGKSQSNSLLKPIKVDIDRRTPIYDTGLARSTPRRLTRDCSNMRSWRNSIFKKRASRAISAPPTPKASCGISDDSDSASSDSSSEGQAVKLNKRYINIMK